jgi:hypothetical protein
MLSFAVWQANHKWFSVWQANHKRFSVWQANHKQLNSCYIKGLTVNCLLTINNFKNRRYKMSVLTDGCNIIAGEQTGDALQFPSPPSLFLTCQKYDHIIFLKAEFILI